VLTLPKHYGTAAYSFPIKLEPDITY
jgi:hypothetical protein